MHCLLIGALHAVFGDYGGVQANATAYFGSVRTNAANGTAIFQFRVFIDFGYFNHDIQFINVTLIQNDFAEKIFTFSNHQHTRNFSIGNHRVVNAAKVYPEIRLLQDRLLVYEDCVIYSYQDTFPMNSMKLQTTIDLDLNLIVLGQNPENVEERFPLAVATVELIKDIPQGILIIILIYALTLSICNIVTVKCPFNVDSIWRISWPITSQNTTISQLCPGGNNTVGTVIIITVSYKNSIVIWLSFILLC